VQPEEETPLESSTNMRAIGVGLRRSLRQIRYLLAAKGRLRHRTSRRPDKHRHAINELGTHGAPVSPYTAERCTEINLVSFELSIALDSRTHQLAVVLKSAWNPADIWVNRVTDVLGFS